MNRPLKLNKSPIVDSICDIRFESSLPLDIVSGILFSAFNSFNIKDIQRLPILEIPESMRAVDPNLLYAPYYHAKIGELTIQLGGRMIALSSPMPYIGWNAFRPQIRDIIEKIIGTGVISQVKRVAIRTVNFFEIDILENSKFSVDTPILFNNKQYHYTDHYERDGLIIKTTIANKAIRQVSSTENIEGSIIDIDSYIETPIGIDLDIMLSNIDKAHTEGKNIFFDLLDADFMGTLEPVYD
jgi:uncharacterized protein (TIGR04255 family)